MPESIIEDNQNGYFINIVTITIRNDAEIGDRGELLFFLDVLRKHFNYFFAPIVENFSNFNKKSLN